MEFMHTILRKIIMKLFYLCCMWAQLPETVTIISVCNTIGSECFEISVAEVFGKVEELLYLDIHQFAYSMAQFYQYVWHRCWVEHFCRNDAIHHSGCLSHCGCTLVLGGGTSGIILMNSLIARTPVSSQCVPVNLNRCPHYRRSPDICWSNMNRLMLCPVPRQMVGGVL